MRGLFLILTSLLLSVWAVRAYEISGGEISGDEVSSAVSLDDMSRAIDSLGRYEVRFLLSVGGGDSAIDGYYIVDEERFLLSIADQQIFGEGAQRCSVNHTQREVVLERLRDDGAQSLVVVNPVSAFAALTREFNVAGSELSDGGDTTINLTPKSEGGVVESSLIEIDGRTKLPRFISYRADGEEVSLIILTFASTEQRVEIGYPADYEVIDIR